MNFIIVCAFSLVLPILAYTEKQDEIGIALAVDSECSSGEEQACTLSALQLRGQAWASEDIVSAPKCGRYGCHSPYHSYYSCQCNSGCQQHNNCCWDYDAVCAAPAPATPPPPPPRTPAPSPPPTSRPWSPPPAPPVPAAVHSSALCSAVPSCARLNLHGACCPLPSGDYLGCCPESMIPHPPAPPPVVVDGHKTLTVYHQTSPQACKSILATEFRIGHGGWCGDAIYFAISPEATKTKAITPHSGVGCMLEVVVDVGQKLKFPCCRYCGAGQDEHVMWTEQKLNAKGYDSIEINPGDGPEIVVYNSDRILSMKEIPFNMEWLAHPMHYKE